MKINHVMSNDVRSGIFDAIIGYFKVFSRGVEYVVTKNPLENADVYHYHRPHLENNLMERSVVTVHHDLRDTDTWLNPNSFYDRYREAHTVICLNSTQVEILKSVGVKNTVVIPHGYRQDLFKMTQKKPLKGRKARLGVVSKRYGRKVKGEAYLYELMKRLNPDDIEWVFVGEGRSIEAARAKELGFDVYLYERLPYRVFGGLYESLDALVMCSWYEGGPANIPEALASATPVIGFDVGMVRDLVVDGINGRLIYGDPEKDASIFIELFGREKKVEYIFDSIRENGLMNNVLTWEDCIYKNVDIYRKVMEG